MLSNFLCSIKHKCNDIRPYAEVEILGQNCLGLLDSGAQVSCIGGSLAEELCRKQDLRQHKVYVCTADGQKQVVFGNIELDVKFNNESKKIIFFIIPSINQKLILGVDFWGNFQIAPGIIPEISCVSKENCVGEDAIPLSVQQERQLNLVINRFPNFEKEGLGKTHLMEHVIELEPNARPVKQRWFPISPAVEKLVHAEIDEMLKLGVIEEAPNSPWSSPVVLVRKSNKVRL
ncbi:uncharacterized protein LOC118734186 [Rhagoletis pomonella]|uniref:uncharacterized protein LOC118734186 n=1 Tax=Rhagoletis pomonella TaxID=28610 RepID=UPI0017803B09|nr:uncharacterized protein LOC118734186 [Rhagoletis pomonella]